MPFGACDHCSRVLRLDAALPSPGSCPNCKQPLQIADREHWQRIRERRRQVAAQLSRESQELMRTSRELMAESRALSRRRVTLSVPEE
jgi:transcription initiation factor IIE alpha subunit